MDIYQVSEAYKCQLCDWTVRVSVDILCIHVFMQVIISLLYALYIHIYNYLLYALYEEKLSRNFLSILDWSLSPQLIYDNWTFVSNYWETVIHGLQW